MAHQAARPDMRYAEMRKETFASSDFEGNKAWTPVKLARAGFFFDPKERRPDRLTCFYCGTSTSYGIYLPEDDPFEVHFKLANDCPWIIAQYRAREWKASQARNQQSGAVRRTRREKAGRGTLHPEAGLSSTAGGEGSASGPFPPEAEEMYSARLDTFGDWWPLERKKGFESCSKEKMARAGLVFVGENSCDDSVECMYCGCELGDWDAGDDPW
ncbi:hypothetical protein BJ742DRAFT_346705 [Cladochytrium replicatum]|nr:hypothetical protein BJ742DRAFT_346705 [Cladochytrium replicatum]